MGKAVSLITDYSLTQLYDFAKSSSDADQCRRLLAIGLRPRALRKK